MLYIFFLCSSRQSLICISNGYNEANVGIWVAQWLKQWPQVDGIVKEYLTTDLENTYEELHLFLTLKPTRCTNFSNLFLEWNSTCFWQLASRGKCSCSQAVSKPVWHIPLLCVQWKTPDDRQRNCPKHVEFHSKNKFEKLVHLVVFIIRNGYSSCLL